MLCKTCKIGVLTVLFIAASSAAVFGQVPIIFPAVVPGAGEIASLQSGILGGPARTIEVNHGGDFQPTHAVVWGCSTVEAVIEVIAPSMDEFRQRLREKVEAGECFAGGPYGVIRGAKITEIPAEGDRPALAIWSMMDSNGALAFGTWGITE